MRLACQPLLLVALLASAAGARADTGHPFAEAPPSVAQGRPFVVVVNGAAPSSTTARLVYADGADGPAFPAFVPPAKPSAGGRAVIGDGPSAREPYPRGLCLVLAAVPLDAPVGPAALMVESAGAAPIRIAMDILPGGFLDEDIALDQSLTDIVESTEARKAEEARRLRDLLAYVDPAGVWLDSGFARPVASERRTAFYGDHRRYLRAGGGVTVGIHAGVDYGCPTGTPVSAAGRGLVVMAEDRIVSGNTVVIEHLPGVYTLYMHLDSMVVAVGMPVVRGDRIGAVGATGLATGPHLHWELRILGMAADPEALVGLDKIPDIRTMAPAVGRR